MTINDRVTVTGNVHLILADDAELTASKGIQVASGNSLTIYGQSQGTGTLVAQANTTDCAGIGGNVGDGGEITIYGGTIEASGSNGAGIGGGNVGDGGEITIYGGTIEASGSDGAGIGGGSGGDGGTITIYGGTVTASSGITGAGIGGGQGGAGGTVTIIGGTVTATSGTNAAGIGSGWSGNLGTFSTGTAGNAVIFASSIQDAEDESNPWRGVIFLGSEEGKLYGNTVTPTEDFTIPEGKTLTIKEGQTLTIPAGVTLTNEGTINNSGTIDVYGTLDGTVGGNGKVTHKVTGVSLSPETLTLEAGDSATLTATVTPENAEDKTVTWSSDNENVAKVEGGKVTAVGIGSTTIKATAQDGSGKYATCEVTVTQPVTGVTLDQTSLTLTEGDSETLSATVEPSNATNQNVTWSSSDPSVATVANGVVTAVGAGTATITVTTEDGDFTATCEVTVERPYVPPANPNYRIDVTTTEGGTVAKDPAAAKAGETVTLTPTPEEGYEVGEVTVTDRFGDAVEVTENADGTYTFTMPNGQVKVAVTFVEMEAEPLPFTDVKEGDWFHDAVRYVYDNGLMDGVGDGQFAPNATTTRAQLVTILYRLAGEPAVSGDVGFTDVESGLWYTNAVAWAAEKGIVNGISETEFAPSGDLTREQLATILFRYAESAGYDVSAQADLSGFPDAGDIQSYATEALSWAVAEGLLQGFEDDSLQPQSTATRAQIATILMRFCETVAE